MSECARPGLSVPPLRRFREIGQLQHLDSLGQAIHLLQLKGQNKRQTGMIDLFLNAAVQAHADDLDPILIRLDVNEKEVIENNDQHNHGGQDLDSSRQSEVERRKFEAFFQFVYENRYLIRPVVSHNRILLSKEQQRGGCLS
jgi:hypothetical protein